MNHLRLRNLACHLALALLMACSQEDLLQKFSSPEDQATAKAYIDRLRARDFAEIEKAADQSIRGPALRPTLSQMADLIPRQEPTSVKLVGAQSSHTAGASTVNTTFEYNFGGKWLLINVAVLQKDGVKTIVGFNVNPQAQSLESQNRFTLSGKSAPQYLILFLAIAAVLLTLYSLIVCIRTKLPGRKWPWMLFILFGFGEIGINWTTGEWFALPLSVQLFSASAFAPLYGPWTISVSVPVGAILFLVYRRARLAGDRRLKSEDDT